MAMAVVSAKAVASSETQWQIAGMRENQNGKKIGERESFGYSIIRVLMDTGFISEEEAFVFNSLVFAGLQ